MESNWTGEVAKELDAIAKALMAQKGRLLTDWTAIEGLVTNARPLLRRVDREAVTDLDTEYQSVRRPGGLDRVAGVISGAAAGARLAGVAAEPQRVQAVLPTEAVQSLRHIASSFPNAKELGQRIDDMLHAWSTDDLARMLELAAPGMRLLSERGNRQLIREYRTSVAALIAGGLDGR